MISRTGTRSSGAASGRAYTLREAGSEPVVTFGVTRSAVVTGLFMVVSPVQVFGALRRVAFEHQEAAEREQGDAEAGEEVFVGDDRRADEVDELRRDDAVDADDRHGP